MMDKVIELMKAAQKDAHFQGSKNLRAAALELLPEFAEFCGWEVKALFAEANEMMNGISSIMSIEPMVTTLREVEVEREVERRVLSRLHQVSPVVLQAPQPVPQRIPEDRPEQSSAPLPSMGDCLGESCNCAT